MGVAEKALSAELREQRNVRDAYGFALTLVFSASFLLIAAGTPVASPLAALAALALYAALVVSLRVSGVQRRGSLAASVVSLVLLVGAWVIMFGGAVIGRQLFVGAFILLALSTIIAVARRLRTYQRVTLQLVMGLLVIYLLLGLTFGLVYVLLEAFGVEVFAQGEQNVSGCVYFSYVTLATLGYGDIAPVYDFARALAFAEAVLGQLYLVSVVSLAVSRIGVLRPRPFEDERRAEEPQQAGNEPRPAANEQ